MALPQITYSPEARSDVLAIETYIATNDGEARAELIIDRIDETVLNLAYMPGMGGSRPYLDPVTYAFPISSWLIVYEPLPDLDGIAVLRVIHGARDLPHHLGRPHQGVCLVLVSALPTGLYGSKLAYLGVMIENTTGDSSMPRMALLRLDNCQ